MLCPDSFPYKRANSPSKLTDGPLQNTLQAIRGKAPVFWQDHVYVLSCIKSLKQLHWKYLLWKVAESPHLLSTQRSGFAVRLDLNNNWRILSVLRGMGVSATTALLQHEQAVIDWVFNRTWHLTADSEGLRREAAITLPSEDKTHQLHYRASSSSSKEQSLTKFIRRPLPLGRLEYKPVHTH